MCAGEPGLVTLFSIAAEVANRIEALTDPVSETFLGGGDECVRERDAIECSAWHAFVDRVRAIAGE